LINYKGNTLDKAVVDLDCFGKALQYVAISRVKTIARLAVIRINHYRFIKKFLLKNENYNRKKALWMKIKNNLYKIFSRKPFNFQIINFN